MINKGEVECLYLNKTKESTKRSAGFSLKIVFFSFIRMTDSLIDTGSKCLLNMSKCKTESDCWSKCRGSRVDFFCFKIHFAFLRECEAPRQPSPRTADETSKIVTPPPPPPPPTTTHLLRNT